MTTYALQTKDEDFVIEIFTRQTFWAAWRAAVDLFKDYHLTGCHLESSSELAQFTVRHDEGHTLSCWIAKVN